MIELVFLGFMATAAARLNGYAAGYGSLKQLEAEIDTFGLSES